MTIEVELSEAQARALLTYLTNAPMGDSVTEDALSLVRLSIIRALNKYDLA
jgi:hypothetical protein